MEKFNIGDQVYFILIRGGSAFIATGRVVAVFEIDELNTRYYVSGNTFTCEVMDSKVFKDLKELVRNFCSRVIS